MTNEIIRADEVVRELRELAGNDDDRIYAPENPYGGIASGPFSEESVEILLQEIPQDDVEIRPDGLIYLPGAPEMA